MYATSLGNWIKEEIQSLMPKAAQKLVMFSVSDNFSFQKY